MLVDLQYVQLETSNSHFWVKNRTTATKWPRSRLTLNWRQVKNSKPILKILKKITQCLQIPHVLSLQISHQIENQ